MNLSFEIYPLFLYIFPLNDTVEKRYFYKTFGDISVTHIASQIIVNEHFVLN